VLHLASFLTINSRTKVPLWDVHVHVDRSGSHSYRKFTFTGAVLFFLSYVHFSWQVWYFRDILRSGTSFCLWEDVVKILMKVMPEVFAWSCAGPYEKILSRSCWHPLRFSKWSLHDLAQVLVRRSCGDRSGTHNVGRLRRRFKIGTAPQRERSDTHKVTKGFREHMLDFYKTLRAQRKMNN